MAAATDELVSKIKKLPHKEQMRIVNEILTDLSKRNPKVVRTWSDEAKKRWAAYKAGRIQTVSYEEVIAKHRR